MNIKSLLTVLGLCLTSLLYAQKEQDYVITMKGDTIVGEISSVKPKKLSIKTATSKMSFKANEVFKVRDSKKQKLYMPSRVGIQGGLERVRGTELDIYHLSKRKANKLPLITEVITDGEIIIYLFEQSSAPMFYGGGGAVGGAGMMVGGGSKSTYFAMKKSTGEIVEIKKSGFVIETNKLKKKTTRDMAKLLEDEPEWLQQFEKEEKLNFDRFVDYVIGYNELRAARGFDVKRYNFQVF